MKKQSTSAGKTDRLVGPQHKSTSAGNADRLVGPHLTSKKTDQTVGDPSAPSPHLGWYKRNLPHCDQPGQLQMITYHLADSLPAHALERIKFELKSLPPEKQNTQFRKKCETWLDAGHGSCILRQPPIAELLIENWKHYEDTPYKLVAYVVMPNHVHVLIHVHDGFPLCKIVQKWKGYTGRMIAKHQREAGNADRLVGPQHKSTSAGNADRLVGPHLTSKKADQTVGDPSAPSQIWHREYWDRFIRNERHFHTAIDYIRNNPAKAGLATPPSNWPYLYAPDFLQPQGACS